MVGKRKRPKNSRTPYRIELCVMLKLCESGAGEKRVFCLGGRERETLWKLF
jgi:hypothetical protein